MIIDEYYNRIRGYLIGSIIPSSLINLVEFNSVDTKELINLGISRDKYLIGVPTSHKENLNKIGV